MRDTARAAAYDLPEQQIANGRETALQELKHNCHGECIQYGRVVRTLARKALDDGLIDADGYLAIVFYQKIFAKAEGLGGAKLDAIRVDGGRLDMGGRIIDQISAAKILNEVRMALPETIVCRGRVDYPRQAFDAIIANPGTGHDGLGYGALGRTYRPSITGHSAANKHGRRAIEAVAKSITPLWAEHRLSY